MMFAHKTKIVKVYKLGSIVDGKTYRVKSEQLNQKFNYEKLLNPIPWKLKYPEAILVQQKYPHLLTEWALGRGPGNSLPFTFGFLNPSAFY